MQSKFNRRPALFMLPVVLLFALAACAEQEQGGAQEGASVVPVVTEIAATREISDRIEAVGTANASSSVTITARVSNTVTRINFTEGAMVRKGDVLVELESSEARANLAEAEATLVEIRTQFQRSQELIRSNAISKSVLDQQQAQVNAAEARVAAARAILNDHALRAPFDGRVGLRRVSVGSLVTPGTVITTLDHVDEMQLDFSVPESFLAVLREGLPIEAYSVAYPGTTFTGKVQSVDARIDPVTRTVTVRARLGNEDGRLRPGMFMTVSLEKNPRSSVVIPEIALVPESDRKYVFVVENDSVLQREVKVGARQRGSIEILEGLEPGDEFVAEGTQSLRHGSDIRRVTRNDRTEEVAQR